MPSPAPVAINIPVFDPKAYGDPTRRVSSQRANETRKSEQELRSPSQRNPDAAVPSEITANSRLNHFNAEANPLGSQNSAPLVTTSLPSFQAPNEHSTKVHPTEEWTSDDKVNEHQSRSESTISQMNSAKKSGSLPRPETFETLKQGSETPEQLIARLQAERSREAFQRLKRKDHGESITTTALTTLDLLRKPLPPDSDGLRQRDAVFPASSLPDYNPNRSKDQCIPNGGCLSSINPTESKQEGKAKRWSDTNEMNPVQWSNAGDCEEPESDNDSTRPMARGFGRLIRSRSPRGPEDGIAGWDGNFKPPPLDWEHRPSFYNNTPEYINGFSSWLQEASMKTMSQGPEVEFSAMPIEEVQNIDNHADGIGFTSKETMIDINNAARYGFKIADLATWNAKQPPDFDSDAKLDLSNLENAQYKDETAQAFIDKRMEYLQRAIREAKVNVEPRVPVEPEDGRVGEEEIPQEEEEPPTPITTRNIYLRPAVTSDVPGMKAILNWHITHGIRPSELAEISDDDMHQRFDLSTQARLPFIVAVERSRKNTRSKSRKGPRVNPNHPIQNIDPEYNGVVKDESIVGWASATDWAACDYVETITAELELYVAASHRQSGVGRCLMDALLDATDRGYFKKGGYDFRVAPEMRHLYSGGGGRDLHKLVFQVRSFNKPMSPQRLDRLRGAAQIQADPPVTQYGWVSRNGKASEKNSSSANGHQPRKRKDYSKAARLDDREDDYEMWLKDWLEKQGFEEEAHLKKLGTKKGRFVDVRYLTRETHWQPVDHRIPDFSHGL
ncbi:hypothetical protein AYO22_10914 [Fonsecaea multimorphosa]|nr:hypothetical protein AYO22_10914 [Fonsecaea multimorphosa]